MQHRQPDPTLAAQDKATELAEHSADWASLQPTAHLRAARRCLRPAALVLGMLGQVEGACLRWCQRKRVQG